MIRLTTFSLDENLKPTKVHNKPVYVDPERIIAIGATFQRRKEEPTKVGLSATKKKRQVNIKTSTCVMLTGYNNLYVKESIEEIYELKRMAECPK